MFQNTRRGFLGLLGSVITAPAIVRADNIMPVRVPVIWRSNFASCVEQLRSAWLVSGVRNSLDGGGRLTTELNLAQIWGSSVEPGLKLHLGDSMMWGCKNFARMVTGLDGSCIVDQQRSTEMSVVMEFSKAVKYQLGQIVELTD